MKIHEIRTVSGPNVYSHTPVLVMKLDLEGMAGIESYEIPGFVDRLIETLPGVKEHHCGLGRPGGFVERLRGGTYFGHIVEHVALEFTDPVGISTYRGKTVETDDPRVYLVAVTYKAEQAMKYLLNVAVDFVQALVDGRAFALEPHFQHAKELVANYELGPSTKAIVAAAQKRGIPWKRADENSLVRLGLGKHAKYVEGTISSNTSTVAVDVASDKELTKRLLRAAALPVPNGCVVRTREEAIECLHTAPCPVVVKPLDGSQGRGVSLNLRTPEQVGEAFELAAKISPSVIVEEMFRGVDFRVVVVDGKMVAAAQRIPPHVWGDGKHSIRDLIELANRDPRRGDKHEKPLTKIAADPIALAVLNKAGHTLDDVPEPNEMVLLRESANLSTGGSARDVTDRLHPTVKRICERAAQTIGLDICGIDLVLPCVSEPFAGRGGIVEVNASPGIRMHHFPSEGEPRDVGGAIVDMLYPDGHSARIPIFSITGTNGKTTVTRMVRHVLAAAGANVGMTTTDGIWIGEEEIARGDMTGPWSAGVVLQDRTVDVAVLETARGGIVKSGLGYDWSDVSIITNVQADHIGQDGIHSVEDIARIKRLVAERVREGGTLVLNADDGRVALMAQHEKVRAVPKNVVWFSMRSDFRDREGTAYVAAGDWVEERTPEGSKRVVHIGSIPATMDGTAEFQVYNVLAAVAACRSYGMEAAEIERALQTFQSDKDGKGRVNLYAWRGAYILLDYAHNPEAIRAVCGMISRWHATRTTGIVGLPGDRTTELTADAARAAACGFDRVIVREDGDLRGRREGEVAEIIAATIREVRPGVPLRIILDELEALQAAAEEAIPGELIVSFTDDVERVLEWLHSHGAAPMPDIGVLTRRTTACSAA
ncbi:MAG TPA: cyanophycin synthetase [Bryobacteraceae bacterium]|jgi:cyanophycin synthetase|nr:cyanophycin synthetase [Bryobacteraceae bacterium]